MVQIHFNCDACVRSVQIRTTTTHSSGCWTTPSWWPTPSACFSGESRPLDAGTCASMSHMCTPPPLPCPQWDLRGAPAATLLPEFRHADERIVHLSVRFGLLLEHPFAGLLRLHPGTRVRARAKPKYKTQLRNAFKLEFQRGFSRTETIQMLLLRNRMLLFSN